MPEEVEREHAAGARAAAEAGWRVLEKGGAALDAVEAAVTELENNELFDAGRGSMLNRDGRVQLDALIMDGATLRAGGLGCVERILNPVQAARLILEKSPHVYFAAEGAERYAAENGFTLCENEALIIPRERERWENASEQRYLTTPVEFTGESHDTVGAVAVDAAGNIAAATSTGGTLNKTPGRIGDSSLIGCGCYADNETAACSTTGWGEPMMKLVLAKHACDQARAVAELSDAAIKSLELVERRLKGAGGMILIDAQGRIGMAHNTPRMAWAWRSEIGGEAGSRLE